MATSMRMGSCYKIRQSSHLVRLSLIGFYLILSQLYCRITYTSEASKIYPALSTLLVLEITFTQHTQTDATVITNFIVKSRAQWSFKNIRDYVEITQYHYLISLIYAYYYYYWWNRQVHILSPIQIKHNVVNCSSEALDIAKCRGDGPEQYLIGDQDLSRVRVNCTFIVPCILRE